MSALKQQLYDKLCELSPLMRNGLFLIIAGLLVLGSGWLLWELIHTLFPVIEETVAFITAGIMWLIWGLACMLVVLYLSLIFQGK